MPVPASDLSLLSEDEHIRMRRLRRHDDQVRSVVSRAALRRMLSLRLGQAPDKLRLVTNRHGKPRLYEDSGIDFNISHAGRFALIALSSTGKVGVDIESNDREIDARSLGEYVFSSLERRSGIDTAEEFIERWVAKESVLKALGLGISEHLQSVSILPCGKRGYEVVCDRPEWAGVRVWRVGAPDGYAAAIAVQGPSHATGKPALRQLERLEEPPGIFFPAIARARFSL